MTSVPPVHPSEFDALKRLIAERFEQLPARLQLAARYLIDHPNEAAVETIKSLSTAAGLQPSGLVRLAQALGYKGFSEMQAVFRSALLAQTQSYGERMRAQRRSPQDSAASGPDDLLRVLCDGSIQSLASLRDANASGALQSAISLLAAARSIHVLGLRRAWPIATYLVYLLSRAQRMVRLLGGMGGMLPDELRTLTPSDLLVAISFQPFHADTLAAVEQARARGIPVLVLSDSSLSSLARNADVVLEARDTDTLGFRSVSASMVLCQGLAVGLAMADSAAAQAPVKRARQRKD
ncbi:MAG: MurR/RpiR family transcriptional regulator [Comamonadaceae bacterium]|nr:MAG: MurR/RpiR family transcriptional regulator [Comamonadaceae bacterium]